MAAELGRDIFFNGDGMVGAFRFKDGHVDFTSKYVLTDKFVAERAARRALYGAYRNPFTDDPSVAGTIRSTANTNVVVHHGLLLALKEDGPPVAMRPDTLETIGNYRFDGKMTSQTFTAHPKIDPTNGELIGFGYAAKGVTTTDIAYYVIDRGGHVVHEAWFNAPRAAMIHDFAVTENYVVFPVSSLTSDIERLKQGEPAFAWQPNVDQIYGVLPRRGSGKDIRWFTVPTNGFQGHTINAWDEGHKVYLDLPVVNDNVFWFFPEYSGHVPDPRSLRQAMTRWTFDLSSNSPVPQAEIFTQTMGEFPHVDERYATRPYRHAFLALIDPFAPYDADRCGPPSVNAFLNGLAHLDIATGKSERWLPGPTSSVQEPVFAPRSPNAPEGDGYVIALVNRLDERRSGLVILDTQHFADGPVAVAHLPLRLRNGLHGNSVPSSELTAPN
ncbi:MULTISPECIES: carotenoid oxygenase family protein [Bradyrhizobium]|uniref:Dioxygenase n=2 Tax=Bradyrhizobium TaxID=374 RepID=A0A9X1RCM6_9BRAD|nr:MULTISPECIES: carotenoid oxygenase family protein [Bradyrhizobium]MCG2628239.1 carotenoid oxygenase family protein [Bradyrhizobium zhengyangense]MCG2643358.1 carotenoid oxygenase family protein [Bradyrhizobium zhengyangense]MCG2670328.1 carotenoid oxygenase family protein [Bradyrhizobium zhengyangense]MDN4985937.1 carotenoid oxygenase family protein [Bradyrhizobium sp. WYCCWR 13022]MDN5002683.1 carotenoid oxygenase family protein [Bradyrhizobium sp. WYCCWR 12677]